MAEHETNWRTIELRIRRSSGAWTQLSLNRDLAKEEITFRDLKVLIRDTLGIPYSDLRIYLAGREVPDHVLLSESELRTAPVPLLHAVSVPDGQTVLAGGGKGGCGRRLVLLEATPNQGPLRGGTAVLLLGYAFIPQMLCRFGRVQTPLRVLSEWRAETVSPPAAVPGPVQISVSVDGGHHWTDDHQVLFHYVDSAGEEMRTVRVPAGSACATTATTRVGMEHTQMHWDHHDRGSV